MDGPSTPLKRLRAVASRTRTLAAIAATAAFAWSLAAPAGAPRAFAGTLDVARADGHGCPPLAPASRAVELIVGTPGADAALLGFDDGQTMRWSVAGDTLAIADLSARVSIALASTPSGAEVTLSPPGTELCTWTATLRLHPAPIDASRIAGLSTRDRAAATAAEAAASFVAYGR